MKLIRQYILLIIAALSIGGVCRAETVSQKQASRIAQTFFNAMYGESTARPKLVWNGRELTTNRLFTPFYVYDSPRGGFVAISADTKAYPVLAYSRAQKFDKGKLGDNERDQFTRFAREIELIRYDSRIPDRAVGAWGDMPAYITQMLGNPYATPEYERLTPEAQEDLEAMDRRNSWIIMPTAVEFDLYNPGQYRDYTLDDVLEPEEIPFTFYEDFLRDIEDEERTRAAAYEEILSPTNPIVKRYGGSHYAILLPDEARLMRVYDVAGARMKEKRYRGTNEADIDLAGLASGYYIALIMDRNGQIYSFKLSR